MLTDLRLGNFRCFETLAFEVPPGASFIVGRNAQGKTSILEAVCVLLRLQSPRTSQLADAVRFGHEGFGIDGHYGRSHLHVKHADRRRVISLDSKVQSRSEDYLDVARVAWFSNTDLELVRGGGSSRRRFLDFLGSQTIPGYLKNLRAYERALRSRNALLKDCRPRREIEAFDAPLVQAGDALLTGRRELCALLAPIAVSACGEISGDADAPELRYQPGCAEADLAAGLAATRRDEERLRQTVSGPHRDDIRILLDGRPAAEYGSEGQQRGIALALKVAQARHLAAIRGSLPLLLIDDVFGELDGDRRNRLLNALPQGAQMIVTTTTMSWVDAGWEGNIFRLEDGALHPQDRKL